MIRYRYMNNFTGELYRNIYHALYTIFTDMIRFPACRTWHMFSISRTHIIGRNTVEKGYREGGGKNLYSLFTDNY